MLTKEDYLKVYEILNATPLPFDCGTLCGSACCLPDNETKKRDCWIYMLPGEDEVHDKKDGWLTWKRLSTRRHLFPRSWGRKTWAVRCSDPENCRRQLRPIQCRTFPLMPYLTPGGRLQIVLYNRQLPYECPLIAGNTELDENFAKSVHRAWSILITDQRIFDYVEAESARMRENGVGYTLCETE